MKFPRRRLLIGLVLLLVLAGIIYEGGRRLLASRYVADKVMARLSKAAGAPVVFDNVDLGVSGTTVHGLRLYEKKPEGTSPQADPWIMVGEVSTNVTLWQALLGETTMHALTLRKPAIHLHFDRQGKLLTQLPNEGGEHTALPAIHIADGRLILDQDGREPMALTGINGDLTTRQGTLIVTGQILDATWGHWTLKAEWSQEHSQGWGRLTCPRVQLNQAELQNLPLVPLSIWSEVNGLSGDTRADFHISVAGPDRQIHSRLTLEPTKADVHIPSIDLSGEFTGGSVVVEDSKVVLRKVEGRTAGGELTVSGELDFRDPKKTQMHFDIDARHLNLVELPSRWDLPRQISGKLSGTAQLVLTVADGRLHTSGEGNAMVTEATLGGYPAKPIELKLHPTGEGFRFSSPSMTALNRQEALLAVSLVLFLQPSEQEPWDYLANLPATLVNDLAAGIHSVSRSISLATQKFYAALPPVRTIPPTEPNQTGYLEVKLGMDQVDLAAFLKNLGVPLPFGASGKLSFEVRAAVPTDTPRDLKAYRLAGSAKLTDLTLESLRLNEVRARVKYANGILNLEELTGSFKGAPNPREQISGSAHLELFPPRDLTAKVTLKDLPLARLATLAPAAADQVAGVLSGNVSFRGPTERLRDVKTWAAEGTLTSDQVDLFGARLQAISVQMKLHEGQFQVSNLQSNLEGGRLTGSAALTLAGKYPYTGDLKLSDVQLAMLQRLSPKLRVPLTVAGRLVLGIQAQGTLTPFAVHGGGKAEAAGLTLEKVTVSSLAFEWKSDEKDLSLSNIQADLYQGKVTGQATLPLRPREKGTVGVHFDKVNLSGLAASLPPLPVRLEGRASGDLDATVSAENAQGVRDWATKMTLNAPQLKLQGIPAEKVDGTVRYQQHGVEYHFTGNTLGGTFHVEGTVPVRVRHAEPPAVPAPPEPEAFRGSFSFDNLRLMRIWEWLGLETMLGPLRGSISFELAYRTGADGQPFGRGVLQVSDLRWGETRFVEDILPGWLSLENNRLHVGLDSSGLGGLVRLRVNMNLRRLERSAFDLFIERVDVTRLLAPWPDYRSHYRGLLHAELRGRLSRDWHGGGSVSLTGGSVYGIAVSEWRLPVTFSYTSDVQQGHLTIHDSLVQFFTGRAIGEASLIWGSDNRLEGRLRFSDVELRHLLESTSETRHFGSGLLTGDLTFAGSNVQSFSDVTARLNANLRQAQALQFPVLEALTPYLLGRLSSVTVFNTGNVKANLAHDIVRIEQLSLQSSVARLFVEGMITVPEGRLNLDTTVGLGRLGMPHCFGHLLRGAVMATNPIPAGLLMEATAHIARVALSLRVTGTYHAPTIQLEPLHHLSEQAVRFFAL